MQQGKVSRKFTLFQRAWCKWKWEPLLQFKENLVKETTLQRQSFALKTPCSSLFTNSYWQIMRTQSIPGAFCHPREKVSHLWHGMSSWVNNTTRKKERKQSTIRKKGRSKETASKLYGLPGQNVFQGPQGAEQLSTFCPGFRCHYWQGHCMEMVTHSSAFMVFRRISLQRGLKKKKKRNPLWFSVAILGTFNSPIHLTWAIVLHQQNLQLMQGWR